MPRVLITNGILRKTLAATRSLGRNGWDVLVGEAAFPNPASWSKYAGQCVRYPNPSIAPSEFSDWLFAELQRKGIDVLLPMDDDVMDITVRLQEQLRETTRLLVPPMESYASLRDKRRAAELAKSVGMSVPTTWWPQNEEELAQIMSEFSYPMVIRARNASGSRGLVIVESARELQSAYRKICSEYEKPMLQTFIRPGPRVDVALLFDEHSRLRASFAQRELRHFPMPRGPSTAVESTQNEELEYLSIKMAERLSWCGVVEFEFMQDVETDRWMFMEANPRMWNSLQLAIECGIDFPSIYADICLREAEPAHILSYPLGIRSRFLWPGDILYFLTETRWLPFQSPRGEDRGKVEKDDVWTLDDPLPLAGYFVLLFLSMFSVKMWKLLLDR